MVDIPDSIRRSVGLNHCACQDWECDFCICPIFEFVFGLKPQHIHIYFYTLSKKRTIKEIATRIDKDRTTAVRLVQSLIEQGLIVKELESLPNGGVRNLYSAISQDILKDRLKETLSEIGSLIESLLEQDWSKVKDRQEEEIST